MKKKVMLGMSGGVDSSCAAILLLEKGYEVTGVTLKLRSNDMLCDNMKGGCCSLEDVTDARRVAYKLGIDHIVMNFSDMFSNKVINYFSSEYINGRTPNPCIACNQHIKFSAMLSRALALDFDYISTGHYAGVYQGENGRYRLRKSKCKKDQSYVLYGMTQFQLAHTLFPLADYEKENIRKIAQNHGLCVSSKPDSQEICFVPDNDYPSFIRKYTKQDFSPGYFLDSNGNILGKHKGIINYTVGQRKNLGISLGKRMYVTNINPADNTVSLGEENSQFKKCLTADNLNFIPFDSLKNPLRAYSKIRYQAEPVPSLLVPLESGEVQVIFDEPQKGVSPGQSVVFYDGDDVLGGGVII